MGPLVRFLPTLALGLAGGWLASWLQMPLPWLLGAMIATTAASLGGVPLKPPRKVHSQRLGMKGAPYDRYGEDGLKI